MASAVLPLLLAVFDRESEEYVEVLDRVFGVHPITTHDATMSAVTNGQLDLGTATPLELQRSRPDVLAILEQPEYEIPGETLAADGVHARVTQWRLQREMGRGLPA